MRLCRLRGSVRGPPPCDGSPRQVGHKRALMENGAITLGRLALACPAEIAPHLPHFLLPWAQCLRMSAPNSA